MSDDSGPGPNMFALFERMGEVSAGLRTLDSNFRQAHVENSTRFASIEAEMKDARHDGRNTQQAVTGRIDKLNRDVDALRTRVEQLEPAVKDVLTLKLRLAAVAGLAASVLAALGIFAEPAWHFLVEHVLGRFFPTRHDG